MHISLVAVNAKYSHSNLALLYLKKALTQFFDEKEVDMTEWDINRPHRELLEILCIKSSSHFFFSTYIWNSDWLRSFIPDLAKLRPHAVICCGGPEAVYNSRKWLNLTGLDYIIKGNAEDLPEEITKLSKQHAPYVLEINPHPFNKTLFPYTVESLTALKSRMIYYEASRGCRFNCSYCLSAVENKGVEYRTEEQIKKEIGILSHFEGTVKFVDRTFNGNPVTTRLIWGLMAENPPAGCFHFEIHPGLLREEDFKMIESLKPGTAQFEIGIQSTNPDILSNVNRIDNPEKTFSNIKRLISIEGFHIHLDQIIGLPGDTPETAAQSFDDILSLQPDMFQPGFLKVLPGTPLSENANFYGIKASARPPYEILESSSFSFEDLQNFHRIEQLVKLFYNSGFFRHTLKKMAKKTSSWHTLLQSLLDTSSNSEPADISCRKWEYWGLRISNHAERIMPETSLLIRDLLRLDWCPQASAQHYPDFLDYSDDTNIHKLKTEACREASIRHPEIEKSALKRSILFIPECIPCEPPFTGRILFVRHEGQVLNIKL